MEQNIVSKASPFLLLQDFTIIRNDDDDDKDEEDFFIYMCTNL